MMSDVPYGAFLSGGVDSAAVVAAMAKRSPQPPSTFTIGFPGHGGLLDERAPAAESARLIGTDHHDTAMVETDFLAELATAMPRLEEPCGIPSAPALPSSRASPPSDVKVVLAGQGADEPHGGYGRHQAAALLGRLRLVPGGPGDPGRRARPRAPARRPRPPRRHLLGGRGRRRAPAAPGRDHRRAGAPALLGGTGTATPRTSGSTSAEAVLDGRRRPRPARAGALPRHAHVPARRHPDLQRQDVDGRQPRAARALPRRRADALRRAHPGPRARAPAPGQAPAPHGDGAPAAAGVANRPKHGFSTPYDDWLRASLGEEVERRYAPGEPLAERRHARRRWRSSSPSTAAAGPTTRAILYCLLELSEWHHAFVEAREPVAA